MSAAAASAGGTGRHAPPAQIPNDVEMVSPEDNDDDDNQGVHTTNTFTTTSKWPESLPHPEAHFILSVVCGNSRYHWALHEPASHGFHPRLYWKTAAPKPAVTAAAKRSSRGSKTTTTMTSREEAAPSPEVFFPKYFPEKASRMILGNETEDKATTTNNNIPAVAAAAADQSSSEAVVSTRDVVHKLLPRFFVQRIPILTIYVISTNATALDDLQHLVSRLPTRLICLQGQDFFNPITCMPPGYAGMGVDRLAALCAAEQLHGGPALVIDGGTATTFTATAIREDDETTEAAATTTPQTTNKWSSVSVWNTVKVRGGGIGPGLSAKFTAMYSRTAALPQIRHNQVRDYVQQCKQQQQQKNDGGGVQQQQQQISVLDATQTAEAMMGYVLRETACHLQSVIATWAKEALSSPTFQKCRQEKLAALLAEKKDKKKDDDDGAVVDNDDDGTTLIKRPVGDAGHVVNHNLTVVLTGGDSDIIMDLLNATPNDDDNAGAGAKAGPILHPDTVLPELPCKVKFVRNKHIIHLAIQHVLVMHYRRHKNDPKQNIIGTLVGQRVAQKLQRSLTRGTVLSCHCLPETKEDDDTGDKDMYQILYDDGNRAELNVEELYEALLLYSKEGEDQGNNTSGENAHAVVDDDLEEMRDAKRKAAKEAAKSMEQCLPVLVARLEDERQAAAIAEAKAAAKANGNGKRVYADDQVPESSKMARSSQDQDATVSGAKAAAPPILPPTKASLTERPNSYVGKRVAKFFDDNCFFGDIDHFDKKDKLWRVIYDDGDEEDFDDLDMIEHFKIYEENKHDDDKR